jgi:hypothetical protein
MYTSRLIKLHHIIYIFKTDNEDIGAPTAHKRKPLLASYCEPLCALVSGAT